MSERQHIGYLDVLRLTAALSVIYMHVASGILRSGMGLRWELTNLVTSYCFTAVPIFFMISGSLLLTSERTRDVRLLRRRLPRILLPLLAWTVVSISLTMYYNRDFSPMTFLDSLRMALQQPAEIPYWYLYTLAAFYIIAPILAPGLQALDARGHRLVLAIIGLVTLQTMAAAIFSSISERWLQVDLLLKMKLFGGHICAFILGYYLGTMKRKIPNAMLAICAAVLFVSIAVGTHFRTAARGSLDESFYHQAGGFEVALAACVFLLVKQNIKAAPRAFRSFVPLLMGVYLMHSIVLRILGGWGIGAQSFQGTVGITLLVFFICFVSIKTVMSVKPLCYLFSGVSYDAACKSCNWQYTLNRLKKNRPS